VLGTGLSQKRHNAGAKFGFGIVANVTELVSRSAPAEANYIMASANPLKANKQPSLFSFMGVDMGEVEVDRFDLTRYSFTIDIVDKKFFLVVRRKVNA